MRIQLDYLKQLLDDLNALNIHLHDYCLGLLTLNLSLLSLHQFCLVLAVLKVRPLLGVRLLQVLSNI